LFLFLVESLNLRFGPGFIFFASDIFFINTITEHGIWSLDGNKDRSLSGNELWSGQDSSWHDTSFSFRFTFHYFPFNPWLKIIFP
jgi:hypothetical protein